MNALHVGALVVMSAICTVHAAENARAQALASARAKLAAMGVDQAALLAKIDQQYAAPEKPFVPQTLVVVDVSDKETKKTDTLAVPKSPSRTIEKARMPLGDVSIKKKQRKKERIDCTIVRHAPVTPLDPDVLLAEDVDSDDEDNGSERPVFPSDKQNHRLLHLGFVYGDKVANPAWQINPQS